MTDSLVMAFRYLEPVVVVMLLCAIPSVAAFKRGAVHRFAITGLAAMCGGFGIMHMIVGNSSDWPMIGWVIVYVWAFVSPAETNAQNPP